jgi:hypothetical protein
MSAIATAQWTPEKRAKKSQAMRGKENISPEARAKQAASVRGVPKSPEAKAKMSEAKRLKWQDPEYRARQVAAQKAFHQKPEARAQAAEWAKLASHDTHRSPEYRQKMSDMKKALETPERGEQRAEITAGMWENDEYRDKVTKAITAGQQRRRERERKEAALKEFARHEEAWSAVIREYTVSGQKNCEAV